MAFHGANSSAVDWLRRDKTIKKTWKPTVAGIINIAFGLPLTIGIFWVIIDHLLNRPQLAGIGLAPILIPLGLIATFSGWICLSRRWWWLALFASILGTPAGLVSFAFLTSLFPPDTFALSVPVYPILDFVALITPTVLIFFSKKEFSKRSAVMEMRHDP